MSRRIITNPTTAAPLVAGGLVIVGILWAANQRPRKKSTTAPPPKKEEEVPPPPPPPPPPASEPCRDDLVKLGYSRSLSYADAVKAFQRNYSLFINWFNRRVPADRKKQVLTVDGICGTLTKERITAALQIQANGGYVVPDPLPGWKDRLEGTWQQIVDGAAKYDPGPGDPERSTDTEDQICLIQLELIGYRDVAKDGLAATARRFKDDYNAFLAWYNGRVPPERKLRYFVLNGTCGADMRAAMDTAQRINETQRYTVANATENIDTITGTWRQVAASSQAWRLVYGS